MSLAQTVPTGERRQWVEVTTPGPPISDGDGGYIDGPPVVLGSWAVQIRPASVRDLERLAAGTVITMASHVLTGRYHPGITTATRLTFRGRTFEVAGVHNPLELNVETIAICTELIP